MPHQNHRHWIFLGGNLVHLTKLYLVYHYCYFFVFQRFSFRVGFLNWEHLAFILFDTIGEFLLHIQLAIRDHREVSRFTYCHCNATVGAKGKNV